MDLVTIATFSNYLQAGPFKSKLENEGVACFLMDEHTSTIAPHMEAAIGGIKLQVSKNDFTKARKILQDIGYTFDDEYELPVFWKHFDNLTRTLPVLGKKSIFLRFLILLITFALSAISTLVYVNQPATKDMLTERDWCINSFTHQGKELHPYSTGVKLILNNGQNCIEKIRLGIEGYAEFPGFNTFAVNGRWHLDIEKDSIFVSGIDTFQDLYEGWYDFELNDQHLILTSKNVTIYCTREKDIQLPF
ncbi:MAG: DUF2007 domain-containing protein [Taibaiella sp.]|nr:DUF2007 domain-containing protein [Taibaiella sp.]